jgi:hypothetical protein
MMLKKENYYKAIIIIMINMAVLWVIVFSLSIKPSRASSTNIIITSCVDHKIILKTKDWRAWKIDGDNQPEEC